MDTALFKVLLQKLLPTEGKVFFFSKDDSRFECDAEKEAKFESHSDWHNSPWSLFTSERLSPSVSEVSACAGQQLSPRDRGRGWERQRLLWRHGLASSAHAQILDCIICCPPSPVTGTLVGLSLAWVATGGSRPGSCQYYPLHTILLSCHEGHITPQELSNHFRVLCHSSWAMSLPWQITDNWRKKYNELLHQKPVFCLILCPSKDDSWIKGRGVSARLSFPRKSLKESW